MTGAGGVQWFRKRPALVPAVPWDGGSREAVEAFAVSPDGRECWRWRDDGGLELWNGQEGAWIPCPAGHHVMRGVLGEFYPVSPAALAGTFDPAGGPEADGETAGQVSYEARQAAKGRRMGADSATPDSEIIAVIGLSWAELPAGMQADEEAGAQAVAVRVLTDFTAENPAEPKPGTLRWTAEDYAVKAGPWGVLFRIQELLAGGGPGCVTAALALLERAGITQPPERKDVGSCETTTT